VAVQDQATQADKRLAGMWGAQRFWGSKPGQQIGSRSVDDLRDMRQPLPAYTPVGGVSGRAEYGNGESSTWDFVGMLPANPFAARHLGLRRHPAGLPARRPARPRWL
jgi:hypothetical protein